MADWTMQAQAPQPMARLPLAAVNGGMQWEAGQASRKRSADVAAAGWEGGAADSAFKRRSFR